MQTAPTLAALAADWRQRAESLRLYGDPHYAKLWDLAATELDRAVEAEGDVPLTITDAAERTGYSPEYLASRVRSGVIPNAGRRGAPRIRAADLPPPKATRRSPGRPVVLRREPEPSSVRELARQKSRETLRR